MKFNEWEPLYREIINDMGYDPDQDALSARILSEMLFEIKRSASLKTLFELIKDNDVLVCGNAPCLGEDLLKIEPSEYCIIAADGATAVLMNAGIVPHIIVTDLDGDIEAQIEANSQGAVMVVHAHGDNIPAINSVVPQLGNIIGSTQAQPLENVFNFGGFTDGDRCVFLAKEFQASGIIMIGFDFNDPDVTDVKKKKLKWAKKLISLV
ncbi:MAG: 6-hydroxymethyl-7,8-dihydropterin pyrophosphokinase [ANME-2 cluster archaeon HR1]|nr:MAG: 6-hydroxymethyl-7,8-dihydropterin pyrophosphokinase [ANME-2 cluster archaeon HR1]